MILVAQALAHDVEGELALRPLVRDGELVGAFTTNGLAERDDDGAFRRVCTESLPPIYDAWLRDDGTFVVGTPDGLVRVPDRGCLQVPDPVRAGPITQFVPVGEALYALDYRPEGGAVLRSDDDGDTFVDLDPLPGGSWRIDGIAADGLGRAVVSGVVDHELAIGVYEGATFVPSPPPDDPAGFWLFAFGPGPDGDGVVVATSEISGASRLWQSSDAGWVPLVEVPTTPTGYGCAGGLCFVATATALYRWDPAIGAGSLAAVPGPSQCLYALDDAVWGCRERLVDTLIEVSRDGLSFEPALATGATEDRPCSADACAAPTPEPGPEPEPEPAPAPEGCRGCSQVPAPLGGLTLPLLLTARRRGRV